MPLVIRDRKGSDEEREPLKPYWSTNDGDTIRLYRAHVIDGLRGLPARSVQCVVTSPPYWGLRDYGTAQWEGGDPKCDHKRIGAEQAARAIATSTLGPGRDGRSGQRTNSHQQEGWRGGVCGKCGAKRIDSQLGSESVPDCGAWGGKLSREFIAATIQRVMAGPQHPNIKAGILTDLLTDARPQPCTECYICRMVAVFDEVRRVLRDDGTVWLNMGDTYASGNCGGEGVFANGRTDGRPGDGGRDRTAEARGMMKSRGASMSSGLPLGNLVGVPWRLALALQASGWVLRQDIVWAKPSPMPESVQNRCTKSHEYIFLLTKSSDYFCDMEAIKEEAVVAPQRRNVPSTVGRNGVPGQPDHRGIGVPPRSEVAQDYSQRNKRSVWTVPSEPYPGSHYAIFPRALIEPCIRAGTSQKGACAKCGAPWLRVGTKMVDYGDGVSREEAIKRRNGKKGLDESDNRAGYPRARVAFNTTGWEPTCSCHGTFVTVRRMVKVRRRKDGAYSDPYDRDHSTRSNRNGMSSTTLDPDGVEVEIVEEEQAVQEYRPSIPLEDHPTRRCIVLDPFMGSGTTAVVGVVNNCQCWGIELSEEYLTQNAIPRIRGLLLSRPSLSHLVRVKLVPVSFSKAARKKD